MRPKREDELSVFLSLERRMQVKIPGARLSIVTLPQVPEMQLALIDEGYPQSSLTSAQVEALMDDPPYWAFCWASGQILARYLLDNPEVIKGQTVVDFGCGSGVVAIAAALAGAARVIALDLDADALLATALNADINRATIEPCDAVNRLDLDSKSALLLVADVFYDVDNIPLLVGFLESYRDVIVADSRVQPDSLTGLVEVDRRASCTVPDLAEATDFNSVGIYRRVTL